MTRLLPPGPRGVPIIGNLLNLPKEYERETFTQWGREFGTVSNSNFTMVKALGTNMLIINHSRVVVDVFGALHTNRSLRNLSDCLLQERNRILTTTAPG
ncbi:hypothetical protein PUNSTDRAFT_73061 [Punctularia strigosozonata HHB-11173 SS5]|uniref:uncharacterized protein n=1 Tax=Punctularia strigosozonata (strain HHB-11173) TaxID=741275 RepID=UPI0004417BCC|nr:uncharacterized protein PUNSTDRAFT_73061 [Punctularia strigosozonata HHB-11173 SS5]EIN05976.1 hypothetical protein PUNSTDRAFT_73061 [Punctularia strigosozonata HHB-11173 SS5]